MPDPPGWRDFFGSIAGLLFESMLIAGMFIGLAAGMVVAQWRRSRWIGIVLGCIVFIAIALALFLGGPFTTLQHAASSLSD